MSNDLKDEHLKAARALLREAAGVFARYDNDIGAAPPAWIQFPGLIAAMVQAAAISQAADKIAEAIKSLGDNDTSRMLESLVVAVGEIGGHISDSIDRLPSESTVELWREADGKRNMP